MSTINPCAVRPKSPVLGTRGYNCLTIVYVYIAGTNLLRETQTERIHLLYRARVNEPLSSIHSADINFCHLLDHGEARETQVGNQKLFRSVQKKKLENLSLF